MVLKLSGCRFGADQLPVYQLPLGLGWIHPVVETILALWLEAHSLVLAQSLVPV